ncbi:hypothetical protein [Streptomyces tateyamensis]|uniref:hypothetical protein n=1 Tax=Streptomyces tateyamensis TaxID=565073 RepID=UPI0011B3A563|nr:hypothetical protein [Streptomyces tateyamensis]
MSRLRALWVGAVVPLILFPVAGCGQAGGAQHLSGISGAGGATGDSVNSGISAAPGDSAAPGGGNGTGGATAGGAPAPTAGAEQAVGRVVLSTYQDWWAAQVKAYSGEDPNGAQVRVYSNGLALANVLQSLAGLRDAKLVMTGQPAISPQVTSVDLNASPQSAVIEDCVDVTGWHQSDPATGSVKDAPQHLTRYRAKAVLRINAGLWKVFEFNREAGRTC